MDDKQRRHKNTSNSSLKANTLINVCRRNFRKSFLRRQFIKLEIRSSNKFERIWRFKLVIIVFKWFVEIKNNNKLWFR